MNEHARLVRVRYDLFNQPIAPFSVRALDVVAKSVLLNVGNRTLEVALLLMEERSWGNRFRSKYRAIK
jgi:hypothetical protein